MEGQRHMDKEKLNTFVVSQVERIVINLYKLQLEVIADLNQLHLAALYQAQGKVDEKTLDALNYFTPVKMGQLRKKTLDNGNDAVREIKQIFEKVQVDFKN